MARHNPPRPAAAAAALLAVGFAGRAEERLPVYPAGGVVTCKGKPLAGAKVMLVPSDKELFDNPNLGPVAWTNERGEYSLFVYGGTDGVPAGEYKVGVRWVYKVEDEDQGAAADTDQPPPPPKARAPYFDPQKSGLTVKVSARGNRPPPIDLK